MKTPVYKIALCLCALILLACTENQLLGVKVKCRNNDQCYFKGEDRFIIDVIITNKHKSKIGYPLEYLLDSGPSIHLVNSLTKKETYVRIGPPDPELQNKFTMIQPGKSLVFEWSISGYDLRQISGNNVDVNAEIILADVILVGGKHVDFEGSDTIRIVSKDKQ